MIWFAAALVLLGVPLLIASMKPRTFRVERSARITAPPEVIFPYLNNFHAWEAWSPYERLDPDLKKSFSGPDEGPGAGYDWEGRKAGTGRMEIQETNAPNRLTIRLQFEKPMKANNTAEFTLRPNGAATNVTWAIYGPQPFMSRLMSVFIDMDRMIGKDFEAGLENLREVAERQLSS